MYNSSSDEYPQEKYAANNPSPGITGNPNIAQPYHATYIQHPPSRVPSAGVRWSSGLCHCCDDTANCIVTCCCPCVTFGQIAEIVDRGSKSCGSSGTIYGILGLTGLSCLYSCTYRSKLRGQLDLEESPCVDCLVHFFCEACALCQEYRELKERGFDMGIGWEANLRRRPYGVTAAPTVAPPMTR